MRTPNPLLALLLLCPLLGRADPFNGFDVSELLIPPSEILRGGPPRDGIPGLTAPAFETAAAMVCQVSAHARPTLRV
ncbi:MAG: hypothetical protein Kow0073_07210 [Immundisolibacter sp.]